MNAARIIETLQREGIAVRRDGDRLKLKPTAGPIPADLIALARAHKPELLQALPDGAEITQQRHRLLAAARAAQVPDHVICELADAEIDGCQWLEEPGLRRYAQIVLENWLVARGVLILHPTDPTKDLDRYRIMHPDSPRTRGTTP